MNRLFFGTAFRMQVFDQVFAVVDPSYRGRVTLASKVIYFDAVISRKAGFDQFPVQVRFKLESSGSKIGAISFRLEAGRKDEQNDN